ncbi:proteasome assembly chaperone family protein [Candidatus Woesearchaeota archaeon]|nr:proteasome assembly chaperone family protein [Candidatus Woesearchaeota archaeon]
MIGIPDIKLSKKPLNPVVIDGFPGFGMVGTIASEFLIDHLKAEQIGKIVFDNVPALVAIHQGKVIEPYGIFYNQKYNLVIMHAMTAPQGTEWKFADIILDVANQLKAKEIISLEGVGSSSDKDESKMFFYTNQTGKDKAFKKMGIEPLNEGIIMGVTSALLIKSNMPLSCIFAETHSGLPDSKAAAKLIEALDAYLELDVDFQPLLDMAAKFEQKIKKIVEQSKIASEERDKKVMSYVG